MVFVDLKFSKVLFLKSFAIVDQKVAMRERNIWFRQTFDLGNGKMVRVLARKKFLTR